MQWLPTNPDPPVTNTVLIVVPWHSSRQRLAVRVPSFFMKWTARVVGVHRARCWRPHLARAAPSSPGGREIKRVLMGGGFQGGGFHSCAGECQRFLRGRVVWIVEA